MTISEQEITKLQDIYNDASLGLTTEKKLYDYLKSNGETGYTLLKIKDFLKSLEVNQVLTKRRGDIFFVAEGPLEQFQIALIYMPKVGLIMVLNIFLLVLMYSVKKQT